jgi:hypothetical protein
MSGTIAANPNIPSVNQPLADLGALTVVTLQLRQGMMSLGGQSGGHLDRAATLNDLVRLGLVTEVQLAQVLRK